MTHPTIRMIQSIRSPRWAAAMACCLAAACSGENAAINTNESGGTGAQAGANTQGGAATSFTGLGGGSATPTSGSTTTGGQPNGSVELQVVAQLVVQVPVAV
jgi:hypothetical protein